MINLLPPESKQAIKFARINVILVQYVVVAIITTMVICSLLMFSRASLMSAKHDTEKLLESDHVRIAELESISADAKSLSETVTTINKLLDKEIRFSYLLKEIGAVMPPGSTVSGLILNQDQSQPVTFSVLLDSAETAGVLQENLVESKLFQSADILNVSRSGTSDPRYNYAANVQAYYDPATPLSAIDDPVPATEAQ